MKKMIAVAMLAVTTAHAEELKFGDVNFFLKKGQSNLVVDVNQTTEEEANKANDRIETKTTLFSTAYSYAFTDQLNALIGFDYAYDRETEDKSTTSNADIHSDGLSNPAFGLNYRLLNQNTSRYNFDLGAVARINIQDAEVGTAVGQDEEDGNFANGRSSLELNARMGRKWNEANEWQLAAGVNYFKDGELTSKQTAGDVDVDLDSSLDLFLRATYQYRPINEFMMLLSAQATRVGEAEYDAEGVGGKSKADAHTDLDFRFVAKYLITDNFIAKFNYGISRNADYDIKTDGVSDEARKRRENFFGLGVDFLF